MNLTSGLSKRYKKEFVLDEDALRRFHGVLEKSVRDISFPANVVFHIEREDDRYYETTDIEEVLSDPNISGKRVTVVSIELRPEVPENDKNSQHSDWKAMVEYSLRELCPFSDPDEIRIRIATHDKNWALLLADELEPQVQRTLKAKHTPRWLICLFLIPFLFLVWRGIVWSVSKLWGTAADMLNFLMPMGLAFVVVGILWLFCDMSPWWFRKAFGPEAAFLWGEEAQSYANREQTRRNIQWGVLVAFLVSLVAGIVVAIATFTGLS